MFVFVAMLLTIQPVQSAEFPFTVHKLKSGIPGPTVLVIGGYRVTSRAVLTRHRFW